MAVLIHTADLHLGRMLYGERLLTDQAAILAQLKATLESESADVLLIAGDVFDRAVPPAEAVDLLDEFLTTVVRDLGVAVVMIPGNHDSADRLGFGARLLGERLQIVADMAHVDAPLVIQDDHGPVSIYGLPYLEPARVRELVGDPDIRTQDQAHRAMLARLGETAPGERRVLVAHAFVSGGLESDSERPLSIGGLDTVEASTLSGFDYVALGHLHRPQSVGSDAIQYAGSPLRYSISECGYAKSFTRIELGAPGELSVTRLPVQAPRELVLIEDTLDALLQTPELARREDLVVARLTDKGPVHNAMQRLRDHWPNAVHVERIHPVHVNATPLSGVDHRKMTVDALFHTFFEAIEGEPMSPDETAILNEIIASLTSSEGAA
jgi:exonuclease SbcD